MTAKALAEQGTWKSWVESANTPGCGFPLQNLPFCAFSNGGEAHLGVGIGDFILDLKKLTAEGMVEGLSPELDSACSSSYLNALMDCGRGSASLLRRKLLLLLRDDVDRDAREKLGQILAPRSTAAFYKPVKVSNYTDFYASIHHATNIGRLFRPDQPLLPNYKFIPIGYHGRASSLVISGTPVIRPQGQTRPPGAEFPTFGPSRQLDYELELGAYVGCGNTLGEPIPIDKAEASLFGISLVNDWSARDIQAWEYQPLGPFLGKSFATSISPWVVTLDALAPFRVPLEERPAGDPEPLPYLREGSPDASGIDLTMEVSLSTRAMRERSEVAVKLSSGNFRDLYWSFAQMVAHHTSNGCNLLVGDLLASGTVSGPTEGSLGSLLEITRRGAAPLQLPGGENRSFLEDGDEVIFSGFCERPDWPRISLGECRGVVVSANTRAGI